ncbi:secreted RxLR effector protein 161-like [Ipomoea triloba]|uniref:secreted RxLR effector protein 161-like n=1 Tax=Ipomoea triloba TaxID=35885 RepID=UPI00125E52E6|nr:secreted RxLR effector protein 161-like [Ipomoea triloba]
MGNSAQPVVEGVDKVIPKMTSRKELTLNNVLYVLDLRKNMVYGLLLNKHGFKMVFDLMHLMSCIRPDIAFAVRKRSRYTSNPSEIHLKAIVRVMRYLRYTRDLGLHYARYSVVHEEYSDASSISDIKDSKFMSGYVFTLAGAAVAWKSSKQTVIARSTMEYEMIALDKCYEESEWLRHFLDDIHNW